MKGKREVVYSRSSIYAVEMDIHKTNPHYLPLQYIWIIQMSAIGIIELSAFYEILLNNNNSNNSNKTTTTKKKSTQIELKKVSLSW